MLKANKLFAMAAKLEEEGIITPNTEVEVSASVSVTPEEQEKIDEALTEVEEIATAESELEEATEQVEELEEAEATLTAIRNIIKRDGVVTPQLYSFLESSGYLDAISAFQKNVRYPATEAISNVTVNKQYAEYIIAGCEAGIRATMSAIWEFIKRQWTKFIEWCSRVWQSLINSPAMIQAMIEKLRGIKEKDSTGNEDFKSKEEALNKLKKNPSKKNFAKFKKEAKAHYKEVRESLKQDFDELKADAQASKNELVIKACANLERKFFKSSTNMTSENITEAVIEDLIASKELLIDFKKLESNAKTELKQVEETIEHMEQNESTASDDDVIDAEFTAKDNTDPESFKDKCMKTVNLFMRYGRLLFKLISTAMANARKIVSNWKQSGGDDVIDAEWVTTAGQHA